MLEATLDHLINSATAHVVTTIWLRRFMLTTAEYIIDAASLRCESCQRLYRPHEIVQVEAFILRVQTLHGVVELKTLLLGKFGHALGNILRGYFLSFTFVLGYNLRSFLLAFTFSIAFATYSALFISCVLCLLSSFLTISFSSIHGANFLEYAQSLLEESHSIVRLDSTTLILLLAFKDLSELIVNFLAECLIIQKFLSKLPAVLEVETEASNFRCLPSLVKGLH